MVYLDLLPHVIITTFIIYVNNHLDSMVFLLQLPQYFVPDSLIALKDFFYFQVLNMLYMIVF